MATSEQRNPPFALLALQSPKLVDTFDTNPATVERDFVVLDGENSVTRILDNAYTTMPSGIFGVVFKKTSSIVAEVMFTGIIDGYSGLTPSKAVFISTEGLPTHIPPLAGVSQQVGMAISTTKIFISMMQPSRRS